MILIFDLDETIYDEKDFIFGGFSAVSKYLKNNYGLDDKKTLSFMIKKLKLTRNNIFDSLLNENKIYSAKLIKKCVSIYRHHKPNISIYNDARKFLETFKEIPKYILTDGNKLVQNSKIISLNLDKYFKKCLITHRYGMENSKPSTYCFNKIAQYENVQPNDIVYIGDDPRKDFVNIKKEGFKTIRLLRGSNKNLALESSFEADVVVNNYEELTSYINKLYANKKKKS